MSRYKSRSRVPGREVDDAALGDEPDGWRSRVEAILKANVHRRVNGRVASHRTVEHNKTVIFFAFDTWHNKLNHKIKIPQKLTDRHVQVLVRYWYEEGKAASTMNNDLSVLRKFFGWMGKKGIVRSLKEYLPDAPADRIERRNMAATGNRSKSWSANGIDVEQKLQEAFALDERFGIILAMQFAFGYRRKETISIRPWINDLRPLGQNAFMMYERDGTKGGRQRLIRLEFPFQVWALDYAKSRISKRAHLGWQKTRRGENATLEYSLERYKYYMKKLGIGRKDVFVTGHGGRAEYAENCALLRGFVPASLGGKANQMPREDLEILEKQVSENLGHSRARIPRDSYYGAPDKAEPQAASSEQVEGSGSGTPAGVADNASQRPPVGTAISLEERLAAAGEPPKGFLDLATSYYRTMPAGRVRPDPSKPPVPGVGRFAAKALSEKAKAEPVKRKGGVRSRPYDERQLRLPFGVFPTPYMHGKDDYPDLEKLRETAERADERLRATEKRALLEIDRERGAVAKLQKEADESTKRADRREADHRRVVDALQAQLGDARHQAGVLQGRLDAVQATNATLQQQLAARRDVDESAGRPARAKAAPARPAVARPSRTPGASRKTASTQATAGKKAIRRKRG